MILTQQVRAVAAALCLLSITPTLALAGNYGSFRSAPAASIRTPSVVSAPRVSVPPRVAAPAAPSSGGYGSFRQERAPSVTAPPRPALTGSDRAISRETSGSALSEMRRQDSVAQQPDPPTRTAGPAVSGGGQFSNPTWTRPQVTERTPSTATPPQWQRQPDWNVPNYAQPRQSYGDWNPFLMWALIASLNRPSSSEFFHNHQNDPGYRQWRAEAEQQARTNADLRAKLDDLDKKLAEKKAEPINAGYVPPEIDPKVAHATHPVPSGGHSWLIALIVILLLGALGYLAWRVLSERAARSAANRMGLAPMNNTDTLVNLVKTKIHGPDQTPVERFKIGQVVTLERTPFLLASGSKIVRPDSDGTTSIRSVGKLSGAGHLIRLYLDDINFLQVSESPDGGIADCRYFTRIDEEYPENADEWRVWLDPSTGWTDLERGILADPKFRTPDNALYDRVWTPGEDRVAPREMRETIADLAGSREVGITAQLFARPMPDVPDLQEYLLVEVREDGPKASVILYAGIDLPATSLTL